RLGVDAFEVVKAEVEVDDVPLRVAEPGVETFEAVRRAVAVLRAARIEHRPFDDRLAFEELLHRGRVADRYRVAEEEDARHARGGSVAAPVRPPVAAPVRALGALPACRAMRELGAAPRDLRADGDQMPEELRVEHCDERGERRGKVPTVAR